MIVVATLNKPCSAKERADFIVQFNHQRGLLIEESDSEIKALEYDDSEKLDNARNAKLQGLSNLAHKYSSYECPIDMYITSSTGLTIDADVCSQTNMEGLVMVLQPEQTTLYKDFNNEFQVVTREQLQTMITECKQNCLNLYQQKFVLEAQIKEAKSIEELNNINIEFEMLNFYEEPESE